MLQEQNLYVYVANCSIRIGDKLGLAYSIANEPQKIMVSAHELRGELGRFEAVYPNKIRPKCIFFVTYLELPELTLTPKIKLVKEDKSYEILLKYLNNDGVKYTIKDAKEKIELHELAHFNDYLKRMKPLIEEINQYEGSSFKNANKLVVYLTKYIEYTKSLIELEGAKLDIKDYVGDALAGAQKALAEKQKEYKRIKKEYDKAKKAFKS